jgi:hypothetical protein
MTVMWTELYQAHFQKFFQKPFDVQVFHDADGGALKLATHDWARQGFRVYASMGLAETLFQDEEGDFGEVILFADVPDPMIPKLFVNALFFILQNDIPIASRFAIAFGNEDHPLARRFGKTALYFTRPFNNDDAFAQVYRGEEVGKVFQAYFIGPDEDQFLDKEGPDAFEAKFLSQFDFKLSDDERVELLVDKSRSEDLSARLEQLARLSNQVLGIRRPSCL